MYCKIRFALDIYPRVQTEKCHEFTMQRKFVILYFPSPSPVLDQNFAETHIHKQRQFVEKSTSHVMIGVNVVVMPSKMEFSRKVRMTTKHQ